MYVSGGEDDQMERICLFMVASLEASAALWRRMIKTSTIDLDVRQ